MSYPYNADTALDPRTWLPGGEAVPASDQTMLPAGSRVLVEGAGTAEVNGIYFPVGEEAGEPLYCKDGDVDGYVMVYYPGGGWTLYGPPERSFTLYNSVTSSVPWGVTWEIEAGDEPGPTVSVFNP